MSSFRSVLSREVSEKIFCLVLYSGKMLSYRVKHMNRFLVFTLLSIILWPLSLSLGQEVIFEDKFEGSLKPGWHWLRENPITRRFGNNSLEIQAEPFSENEAHNVLIRSAVFRKQGKYQIETELSYSDTPTSQYQQGGIYWIQDDRVIFKLVHELVDGKMYIFPGKVPIESTSVKLRITVNNDNVTAEFCNAGENNYRCIYEGKIEPPKDTDRIGLQCWHGPKTGDRPWLRFHYFRVIKVND